MLKVAWVQLGMVIQVNGIYAQTRRGREGSLNRYREALKHYIKLWLCISQDKLLKPFGFIDSCHFWVECALLIESLHVHPSEPTSCFSLDLGVDRMLHWSSHVIEPLFLQPIHLWLRKSNAVATQLSLSESCTGAEWSVHLNFITLLKINHTCCIDRNSTVCQTLEQ